jgi:hypothetical protein
MRALSDLAIGLLNLGVSIVFLGLGYSAVRRLPTAIIRYAQEPEDVWGLFLIGLFALYLAVTSLLWGTVILSRKLLSTAGRRLIAILTFSALALLVILSIFGFWSSTPADKDLRLLLLPASTLGFSYYYLKHIGSSSIRQL